MAVVVPSPLEKQSACLAPSSEARQASSTPLVGLPLCRTRLGEGLSVADTYPAVLVHLEVRRGVLLEGGGEGDLGDHGHAVPLLWLLAHVESLGGEVLVILSVLGHGEQLCDCVRERPGLEWRLTGILLPHIQLIYGAQSLSRLVRWGPVSVVLTVPYLHTPGFLQPLTALSY